MEVAYPCSLRSGQPGLRTNPFEPGAILEQGQDPVIRQAIRHSDVIEEETLRPRVHRAHDHHP